MPLDEFYYGKTEGNPTYQETKAEYRYKVCFVIIINNRYLKSKLMFEFGNDFELILAIF